MKSIVLLSGGLDSTVAMAAISPTSEIVLAVTFDYGQRAVAKEIQAAGAIADYYGIPHKTLNLAFLMEITKTSLVNYDEEVPKLNAAVLDNPAVTQESASNVWVPNRNGVFVNIAAAFCDAWQCEQIVVGFNAEEGATFPDNTPEYMAAATLAFSYSTLHGVKLVSPTVNMTKTQMVELGRQLKIPFHLVWSCYHGGDLMCGACESCQRLKRALTQAEVFDAVRFG